MSQEYFMPREDIDQVYKRAWLEVQSGLDWRVISKGLQSAITDEYEMRGLELMPEYKQIIAVVNHPSHMDYFLGAAALKKRPDLKMVARVPPADKEWSPARTAFLTTAPAFIPLQSKEDGRYVSEGVKQLTASVRDGVSMIIVPWGCMDHQASEECTADEAVHNILALVERTRALVLHVEMEIESKGTEHPGSLPFSSVSVTIHHPILSKEHVAIAETIAAMYQKFVTPSSSLHHHRISSSDRARGTGKEVDDR